MKVFSTRVLIGDAEIRETNIANSTETWQKSQLVGCWPDGYLQSKEDLNLGPPNTHYQSGGREDELWTSVLHVQIQCPKSNH